MCKTREVLLIGSIILLLPCCTNDDIPVTPAGPFLFTNILITKGTSPALNTPLKAGQPVNFNIGVAYTLDPQDQANIKNVVMKLDFDAVDSSLDFVEEIGGVPDSTITLNAAGTNFQVPITETIPATGPAYVRLTAELSDSVGTYLVHDIQYWPLQ